MRQRSRSWSHRAVELEADRDRRCLITRGRVSRYRYQLLKLRPLTGWVFACVSILEFGSLQGEVWRISPNVSAEHAPRNLP